jgi:peptide/nickel transport system substrate-binding protein
MVPSRPSTGSPPKPEWAPVAATLEALSPAKPADNENATGWNSVHAGSRMATEKPMEDAEAIEQIGRILERRRARRMWLWLGTAGVLIGFSVLGAILLIGGVASRMRPGVDGGAGALVAVPARSPRGDSVPAQLATPNGDGSLPAALSPNDEQGLSVFKPDQRGPGSDQLRSANQLRSVEAQPGPMPTRDERIDHPAVAQTPLPTKPDTPDATATPNRQEGSPPAPAAEKSRVVSPAVPRAGGELTFIVPAEPPSYDAHREETFALIHPAAPHYNTLLRIDPVDKTGTRVVGDLAESWAVSADKRTYILKLRRGVKFHDGSEMTSRDVRATYEKIIKPPPGVTSVRKGEYLEIEVVQTPEPYVVAFKLKWPSPSFIHSLASPWNWIYKADILERDIHWYETHVMGTGPFTFVEHVRGSHWVGRRNPNYWDSGKPYLDGYRALFVRDDAAQAFAIRAERADIQFRGFSPAQRDDIVRTLGEKITVQESPWNCGLVVAINHEKKPFDDRRVRRALSLALDRYQAAGALSKIAIVREVAGVQVPNTPFATSPADLVKLAGYGRDIRKSRAEAGRLLAEAGVDSGLSFTLKNRNVPMPYEYIGTWLVDQWRQIGLKVRQESQESALYFRDLRAGNFEVSTDFQCGYVVDPDLDLYKFQSQQLSDSNYGRYSDPVLDDLYQLQSRTVDPEQRRRHIRAFEKRLLDEEVHYIYTLQWHRIVTHSSRVRGWTITPSHYLNSQLDTVWLAE